MHKQTIASGAVFLVAALAVIAATGFQWNARAGQPANSGSAAGKVVTVVIRDFQFEPATVTVHAGDTIEWKNDDIVPHTATASGQMQKPAFDSGTIRRGATWRYVARKIGTYEYICTRHPNMKGTLVVQ